MIEMNFNDLWQSVEEVSFTLLAGKFKNNSDAVDIETIIKDCNIRLEYMDLDDKLSGQFNIGQNGSCLIVVNKNHHKNRQRFTLAHELGHYTSYKITNKIGGRIDYIDGRVDVIKNRDDDSSLGTDLEEMFANKFAAAILMPRQWLLNNFDKKNNIDEEIRRISLKLEVSIDALKYRLLNLKIIGI